jgi:Na+/H+ antiporter NhaB
VPVTGTAPRLGAGVEKSIRSSSPASVFGDFLVLLLALLLRDSSKVGMALGGVRGMVGFRIDLICGAGEAYTTRSAICAFTATESVHLGCIACALLQCFQSSRPQTLASQLLPLGV